MLPFLMKKKESGVSGSLETIHREHDEDKPFDELEIVAEELCQAIEAKDHVAIASALRSAFEILDSQPHEEGPHE